MEKTRKRTYYKKLPKAVTSVKFECRGYEVTIINQYRILRYYIKKIFHYFFENKQEFYMHAPYIAVIFIGVMLNVVAKATL